MLLDTPVWMAAISGALGEVDEGIGAIERGLWDWGPGHILTRKPGFETLDGFRRRIPSILLERRVPPTGSGARKSIPD